MKIYVIIESNSVELWRDAEMTNIAPKGYTSLDAARVALEERIAEAAELDYYPVGRDPNDLGYVTMYHQGNENSDLWYLMYIDFVEVGEL